MCKPYLTLVAVLLFAVAVSAIDISDQIYIVGTNTATYLQQEEDHQRWMWDDLSTELTISRATIGITAELYQPKRLLFGNPPDSIEHNEITRRFLRYQDDDITVYVGNYEKTLGRGLVFRSYYDSALDEDKIVDGVMASTDVGDFADVTALFGSLQEEGHDNAHKARGAEINLYPFGLFEDLPNRMLSLKGEIVSSEVDVSGTGHNVQLLGGGGSFNWDYCDAYGEYVQRQGYDEYGDLDDNDGSGLYVSGNVYLPYVSLSGEYKDYDHLSSPFCSPPPATHSGQSINNGGNESGYIITAGSKPFDPLYVEGGYAKSETDGELYNTSVITSELVEYYFLSRFDVPFESLDMTLEAGYTSWDEATYREDNIIGDLKSGQLRTWPWGRLTYNFLDDHTVLLEGEYEKRTVHSIDQTYTDRRWDAGYTFRSMAGFTVRYEDSNELVTELYGTSSEDVREINQWVWYESFVDIGAGRKLTLGYGSTRGGIVCSSGVCRHEAPFKGFKIELTGSF